MPDMVQNLKKLSNLEIYLNIGPVSGPMALISSTITAMIDSADADKYHHLNNGNFPKYFEFGRDDLAKKCGLDHDSLGPLKVGFLTRKATYTYIKPVMPGMSVDIRSSIKYAGGVFFILSQEMYHNNEIMAVAKTEYCFVNLITDKPIKPLKKVLEQFIP